MSKKPLLVSAFAIVMLFGLGFATSAQAFSIKLPGLNRGHENEKEMERGEKHGEDNRPGVRLAVGQGITGTVTAVSSASITVNGKHASSTGSFVVDVSNARFFKNSATTTISSIIVGDTVFVQGAVNGTSAVAVAVYDGKLPAVIAKLQMHREEKKDERKEDRQERREDRIADHMRGSAILGVVTSVSGNTLLVDGKMGTGTASTTFTVDATNAKIFKDKATTTVSAIVAGDKVLIEGAVNGTSVSANVIFDGKFPQDGKALKAFLEEPSRGKFMEKMNNLFKKFFRKDK